MSKRSSVLVAEETVNNLKRLFHLVNKNARNMACDAGLSSSQLWALKVLSDEPESSMTVSSAGPPYATEFVNRCPHA